jgi:hypothetical protein
MKSEEEIRMYIKILQNQKTKDILQDTKRVMQLVALLWVVGEYKCLDI